MYVNSGYLNNSRVEFQDTTRPLVVGSCGTCRLYTRSVLPAHRPKGRVDYQLLYIAAGSGHFFFDGTEQIVETGHVVLYRPGEEQRCCYYASEHPEIFWVHFTGYDVNNILEHYAFTPEKRVYRTGTLPEFRWLFTRMIRELQTCRPLFEQLLASLLNDLLLLICRQCKYHAQSSSTIQNEIEEAAAYFYDHYNENISIQKYANAHHISTNHFIRSFRLFLGVTPARYLLTLRMTNAQSLLEAEQYSIKEIAAIVGYHDPLYFSQMFRKVVGVPPSEYRRQMREQEQQGET